MSAFKDMLAADRAIFLNVDEFGETHTVEGKSIEVVLDDDIQYDSKHGEDIGLAEADLALYARDEDLPVRRATGEALNIDGKEYTIVSWRTDYGVAVVYLAHQTSG